MDTSPSLRINEIFYSLQGETATVGLPTVFVRLTGCPLRCVYCDTAYAFHKGDVMQLDDILGQVKAYGARYVTVTGGEPLAQPECLTLMRELCDVVTVLDLKTPGSGECDRNLESNIRHLKPIDQVKFVICDRRDYEWAKAKTEQFDLRSRVSEVLFSPSFEQLSYRDLAEWILADRLVVRMQLQLHKHIWGDKPGH